MNTVHRVEQFHRVFGHPVADKHFDPQTPKIRLLRFRLLFEELMEYGRAIGIAGLCELTDEMFEASVKESLAAFSINEAHEVDLVEAADALGDIDYVCAGANIVHGFPAEEVAIEIHRANMSKLGADGQPIYDEHKKVVKGPNYTPPDVAGVLADYICDDRERLTLPEWKLVVRAYHPTAKFAVENGEGAAYGAKGDWVAAIGPDMQADVVGVWAPSSGHSEVQVPESQTTWPFGTRS